MSFPEVFRGNKKFPISKRQFPIDDMAAVARSCFVFFVMTKLEFSRSAAVLSESEKKLIAPCGLYCGCCDDYIAHVNNDEELKKKVAAAINKQLDMDILPGQVGCEGCRGKLHTKWSANLNCEVRRCAEQKGVLSCVLCDDFACEKLRSHFAGDINKKTNLHRIREIGLEAWLCGIKKKK